MRRVATRTPNARHTARHLLHVWPSRPCLEKSYYLGEVHHGGKWYPAEHKPILDQKTFDQVQAWLAENRLTLQTRRSASRTLLAGKLRDDRGIGTVVGRVIFLPIGRTLPSEWSSVISGFVRAVEPTQISRRRLDPTNLGSGACALAESEPTDKNTLRYKLAI